MNKKDKNTLMAERKREKAEREKIRKKNKVRSEARLMFLEEAEGHKVRVRLDNGQVLEGLIRCQGKKLFSIGDAKDGNVSQIDPTTFTSDQRVMSVDFSERPYICVTTGLNLQYKEHSTKKFQDGNVSQIDPTTFSSDQVMSVDFLERHEIWEFLQSIDCFNPQYKEYSTKSGNVILSDRDNRILVLKETVARQMPLLKNLMETNNRENPIYCLPGVKEDTLCMVIICCQGHITMETLPMVIKKFSRLSYINPPFVIQLFNIIQAAHYLKIKSLMDLTCNKLRKEVETLWTEVAIALKTKDLYACLPGKQSARVQHPQITLPVIARRGPGEVRNILRSHERETFIMQLDSEDVHCSPFAANMLSSFFNKKSKVDACDEVLKSSQDLITKGSMTESDFDKLYDSLEHLKCSINGEPRLAEHLSADVAHSLVQILIRVRHTGIKLCCISILSRTRFDKCSNVIEGEALPLFVELMNSDYPQLVREVLIALWHLVYAYPNYLQVILKEGALETAQNIFSKDAGNLDVMNNFSNLMAALCRGVNLSSDELSNDKVNTILTILEELFKQKLETSCHIVRTCYALSYLSYKKSVPMKAELLERLTKLFIDDDMSIAAAALGVVANIARWGSDDQIQFLAEDPKLLQGLGSKWLGCEFKIFQKGACRIISNMAAQNNTFRENMLGLIGPLLDLLFKENKGEEEREDEFDVPMEAAWSFLNSSYEYDVNMIDKYNYDNPAAGAVLHLNSKRTYNKLMYAAATTFRP